MDAIVEVVADAGEVDASHALSGARWSLELPPKVAMRGVGSALKVLVDGARRSGAIRSPPGSRLADLASDDPGDFDLEWLAQAR